ncbi:DoxX family protein [Mucilaginibacter conchicola]|uniref:DoxX family protein n=1 Tax=Mucilaginibacter conchicola TaxID=2303333 RepID=A0A372NW08_9SPHI|nr:DoxX family protein [Mucilaginibacter conchicola]RFZ94114.1 DoxX family protein [Mucilaginibacter conchicola]
MSKTKKIIYWLTTAWLALGMASTGVVQLMKLKAETAFVLELGFPVYILTLIGLWKLLGVVAVLVPKMPLLKEWAYAGFFFVMTGALYSHLATGKSMDQVFGASLLLVLTVVSWYLRPANRKLSTQTTNENQ